MDDEERSLLNFEPTEVNPGLTTIRPTLEVLHNPFSGADEPIFGPITSKTEAGRGGQNKKPKRRPRRPQGPGNNKRKNQQPNNGGIIRNQFSDFVNGLKEIGTNIRNGPASFEKSRLPPPPPPVGGARPPKIGGKNQNKKRPEIHSKPIQSSAAILPKEEQQQPKKTKQNSVKLPFTKTSAVRENNQNKPSFTPPWAVKNPSKPLTKNPSNNQFKKIQNTTPSLGGNSEPLFHGKKEHQPTKTKIKRKRKPIVVVRPRKAQPKKFKENESKIQDQQLVVPLRQEIPTVSLKIYQKKCKFYYWEKELGI